MTTINIEKIPSSIEAFVSLRDGLAQSPEGGAAIFVTALIVYTEDQPLGRQCLTIAADRARLREGSTGYKGWELIQPELRKIDERIKQRSYVARSYVLGTSADAAYALPAAPHAFEITDNPHSGDKESGTYKVFVRSSGADSARPISLKRNNKGLWKASEWSSLSSGVVPPVQQIDDRQAEHIDGQVAGCVDADKSSSLAHEVLQVLRSRATYPPGVARLRGSGSLSIHDGLSTPADLSRTC